MVTTRRPNPVFQEAIDGARGLELLEAPFEKDLTDIAKLALFASGEFLEFRAQSLADSQADLCLPLSHCRLYYVTQEKPATKASSGHAVRFHLICVVTRHTPRGPTEPGALPHGHGGGRRAVAEPHSMGQCGSEMGIPKSQDGGRGSA